MTSERVKALLDAAKTLAHEGDPMSRTVAEIVRYVDMIHQPNLDERKRMVAISRQSLNECDCRQSKLAERYGQEATS